jgi:hypothetical protein
MMKRVSTLAALVLVAAWPAASWAQNAEAEKTIIANERAVNEAVVKGNLAGFKEHVATDGWAIDSMTGRSPVSDFVKQFDTMTKEMKVSSWDISESKVQWVDANTAVHSYKWTGTGTYQGQPVPSPVWASTVWTKKGGKWTAVFHQESVAMPMPPK